MNKSRELLEELMHSITTTHLDMSGNHRYALSFKSMKIIPKIKAYLSEPLNKVVEDRQAKRCVFLGNCDRQEVVGCNSDCDDYSPAT